MYYEFLCRSTRCAARNVKNGNIAQQVEPPAVNRQVKGSSPFVPSIFAVFAQLADRRCVWLHIIFRQVRLLHCAPYIGTCCNGSMRVSKTLRWWFKSISSCQLGEVFSRLTLKFNRKKIFFCIRSDIRTVSLSPFPGACSSPSFFVLANRLSWL